MSTDYKTLTQWAVKVNSEYMGMFTPLACDSETAMAIAVATWGHGVSELIDEGTIRQELTSLQFHVADSKNCAECGEYESHSGVCSKATDADPDPPRLKPTDVPWKHEAGVTRRRMIAEDLGYGE